MPSFRRFDSPVGVAEHPALMRRPSRPPLSHPSLVEEAHFIVKTLLRDDLFGDRIRLTEAESVIESSISLSFADYCGFLNKYGYVRIDQLANVIAVTDGGRAIVRAPDDADFHARLGKHFARELGTAPIARVAKEGPPPPPKASLAPPTAPVVARTFAAGLDDVIDRRYRRGAMIGEGPVGSVYEAEHIGLGRPVAIKEARSIFQFVSYLKRDEIVRRLKSSIQMQAKLDHPNILGVFDQNHEREFPYVVSELAHGGNLRRRLDAVRDGRLDVKIAIRILVQLCYALKHAHGQDILHLGIKPENVLFDRMGNAKLGDFGTSTIMDRAEGTSQIPVLVGGGTVGYMAPERLQPDADEGTVGPSADIYALGILTYQMLTGKLPGRRSPLPSQFRKSKDLPAAFDDVFDRMTRDELTERYATVDEVLVGVYKAFPSKDVATAGTIMLWAADPAPPPEPEAEAAPEPEDVVHVDTATTGAPVEAVEAVETIEAAPLDEDVQASVDEPVEAVVAELSDGASQPPRKRRRKKNGRSEPAGSEAITGEVDVSAFQDGETDEASSPS